MKKLDAFILLQWFDSAVGPSTGVYTPDEALAEKLIVLETVGWLVGEKNEPYGGYYILAVSKHGDTDWRGIQVIPKANVITIQRFFESTEGDTK